MPTKPRAITSPQATIDMLERAITETRDSNRALREAVELLHAAIFGRPDADPKRSLPGLQNSVTEMRVEIQGVSEQVVSVEGQVRDVQRQIGQTAQEIHRFRWLVTGAMATATIILSLVDLFIRTQLKG